MKNITPKHDEGKLYAPGFASRALGYRPRRLSGAISGGRLHPCWMGTVRGREVYGLTAEKIAMYAAVANRGGPDSPSIAAVSGLLEDQPRNARDWLQRHFDAMGEPPPDPQVAPLIEAKPVAFNTSPLPSDAELLADAQRERDYHLEQRRERMLAAADARDGTNGQELTIATGAALTAADATRINDYAAAGVSPNTLRAYGSQWRQWVAWTEERGLDPVAALTDAALASYLTERADNDGSAPATLSQAVAALRQAAKAAGRPDPFGRDAAATMKGIRRKHSDRGKGQVAGVRWRELERAATLATADASLTGLRDAAILRLGSDALLRVSELAAVAVEDVKGERDGSGRLTVRRSKTDQEAKGVVLYVGQPTLAAVNAWKRAAKVTAGPLFRRVRGRTVSAEGITASTVRRAIVARSARAGIAGRISGHSLRVGSAQDLAAAGAGLVELQNAGRWQSPVMPSKYSAGQLAGRGAVARLRYGGAR